VLQKKTHFTIALSELPWPWHINMVIIIQYHGATLSYNIDYTNE